MHLICYSGCNGDKTLSNFEFNLLLILLISLFLTVMAIR